MDKKLKLEIEKLNIQTCLYSLIPVLMVEAQADKVKAKELAHGMIGQIKRLKEIDRELSSNV